MFTVSANRVSANTPEFINERIKAATEAKISCTAKGGPAAIDRRLVELDLEWDIERCLETMAPSLSLFGLGMGIIGSKKWLIVPLAVQAFFLEHALQGWCPPLPMLRYLGVRTADEINEERNALKALRGDYKNVPRKGRDAESIQKAVAAASIS
ncbi:MAG: hypothetical protein QM703_27230 [Gemmatales bacterium]